MTGQVTHIKEIYRYGTIMLLCVSPTLDHEVNKLTIYALRHDTVTGNATTLSNLRTICKTVRSRQGYCLTPIRQIRDLPVADGAAAAEAAAVAVAVAVVAAAAAAALSPPSS
jgi:hypothetical protein